MLWDSVKKLNFHEFFFNEVWSGGLTYVRQITYLKHDYFHSFNQCQKHIPKHNYIYNSLFAKSGSSLSKRQQKSRVKEKAKDQIVWSWTKHCLHQSWISTLIWAPNSHIRASDKSRMRFARSPIFVVKTHFTIVDSVQLIWSLTHYKTLSGVQSGVVAALQISSGTLLIAWWSI